MKLSALCTFLFLSFTKNVCGTSNDNVTLTYPPAARQLYDFKTCNPTPVGTLTTSAGKPVEIRETNSLNTDFVNNEFLLDHLTHLMAERVPERIVHAKGSGAFGYFEVTNDVSMYTKADLFNGIGKNTPLAARFSSSSQSKGGNEITRELKGMSVKFYTKEGILDLLGLNTPVYFYTDPIVFHALVHSFKKNPASNLDDFTAQWDYLTLKPSALHTFFYIQSNLGNPNGYRRMNAFPIHTYELHNRHGERYYARFSMLAELGFQNLTTAQAATITDMDYFTRDLYDNIAMKNYPAWRLQMDVMTLRDLKNVDYDPFDATRLWKNGTYLTVPIGRIVVNRNPDNFFRNVELSAYNPSNLVPGIEGVELLFKSRRLFYRDTQKYRLGINHMNIEVNSPNYARTYHRDGYAPVKHNMKDVPNYMPNSFNGPIPYVDKSQPKEKLVILHSNAVDLEPLSEFYNLILANDGERQALADNLVLTFNGVTPPVLKRSIRLLALIDPDLGKRVLAGIEATRARSSTQNINFGGFPQCMYAVKFE